MDVSDQNNAKIYNLSSGKSLPEWLSDRKRRALLKKDVDLRRRIELIQDFDMPVVSNTIKISNDGQYILATGVYKPRVKCFDVNNLSLKFERCFDSEAVTFEILSDDYSKLVFLQCDRYIEFHVAHGRHYRIRVPRFGRDMKYHYPSCDLFVVGASSDIYRLNLERGQFMTPYTSQASAINKCAINPVHHLLVCGTQEGTVEAWDPRTNNPIASLDCAFSVLNESNLKGFPAVTALKFNGDLTLAVGTATGQVLLYDIRFKKPLLIKDHMFEKEIKSVDFHYNQDLIYSLDGSALKIWDKNNGKIYTSIQANYEFNNLCTVPNTGLFFLSNEHRKMQTYYVPNLGPAPKWACFLDSLTEELEETNIEHVYDDYKFITQQELEMLGLEHLIGTNFLRAYMHGYFMDIKLYKKARSLANPFEFEQYQKAKVHKTIEKDRIDRLQISNTLPKVNKDFALKLIHDQTNKKKKINAESLMKDERFSEMFKNPDFEIDKNTDEFRLLNPVLSRLDQKKPKKQEIVPIEEEEEEREEESENSDSSEDDLDVEDSSDDEHTWTMEMKKQHKLIQREHKLKEKQENDLKLIELKQDEEYKGIDNFKKRKLIDRTSLGERLKNENGNVKYMGSIGNREMTFSVNKKRDKINFKNKKHREERKQLIRPTNGIRLKSKGFFKSKRK